MAGLAGMILRALKNRSGNVAVMAGVLLPTVLLAAVLGVDQGSLYFERREAQALTDLAAITAAANIARADTAALLTMSDNRQQGVELVDRASMTAPLGERVGQQLLVETGRYEADAAISPAQRFTPGATPPNAARVTLRKRGTLRLGSGIFDPPIMTTTGTATARAEAAFSVGSRLLSADTRESILNPLLGGLLGTNLNLHLMDYSALANADIDALAFTNALATQVRLTAGTYDDVLAAEATLGQVLRAVAASTTNSTARQLVLQLASGSKTGGLTVPLSHLIDIGSLGRLAIGEQAPGMQVAIGVLDLVSAAVGIANQGEQVSVELGVLPGLGGVVARIAIGEPPLNTPWFAIGETGTIVRTAQTRLYLELSVTLLKLAGVKLPLYLEIAFAEAQLREVACSPNGASRVVIDARPGIFEAWIGKVDPSQLQRFDRTPTVQPVELLELPLLLLNVAVNVYAHVGMAAEAPQRLTFSRQDIEQRAIKSVHSRNFTQPLLRSLADDLDVTTKPQLVGAALDPILEGLISGISGLGSAVDPILYNILTALGVRLGEADIRVNGVSCSRSVLVN